MAPILRSTPSLLGFADWFLVMTSQQGLGSGTDWSLMCIFSWRRGPLTGPVRCDREIQAAN